MHDHNLDDLIIDNIEPKNSKLKSFLTIIALLIVILIVAIVLTRILLKTPDNNALVFEQESAELIAPELKLQETPKSVEVKKEPVLTDMVESTPEPTVVVKKEETKPVVEAVKPKVVPTKKDPELSDITQQEVKAPVAETKQTTVIQESAKAAKDAADMAYWESVQAQRKAEQEAREKAKEALQTAKPVETKKVDVAVVQKPKPTVKPVEKTVVQKPVQKPVTPKSTSTKKYYVQVGSFKKQPSARFISVIRNNGFKYRILRSPKDGTKKLLIGPYEDRAAVNRALVQVKDRINKRAFVVKR